MNLSLKTNPLNLKDYFLGSSRNVKVLLGIALFLVVFFTPTAPIIFGDAFTYLKYAENLSSFNLVNFGSKQLGYSYFIYFVDLIDSVFGLGALNLIIFFQKIIFFIATCFYLKETNGIGALAILSLFHWRVIGLLNVFYPEALTISLLVLYAALLFRFFRKNETFIFVFISLLLLFLTSVKIQYAALYLPFIICYFYAHSFKFKASVIGRLIVSFIPVGALVLYVCFLNFGDYGKFWIAANTSRVKLHHGSVTLKKNLKLNAPSNSDYGKPIFKFIHGIEAKNLPVGENDKIFKTYHDEMFNSYGVNPKIEQLKSSMAIWFGGRKDEIAKLSGVVFRCHSGQKDNCHFPFMNFNRRKELLNGDFLEKFNAGKPLIILNPFNIYKTFKYGWSLSFYFAIFSILSLVISGYRLIQKKEGWQLSASLLVTFFAISVVLGVNYLDQFRYSLTGWIIFVFFSMSLYGSSKSLNCNE